MAVPLICGLWFSMGSCFSPKRLTRFFLFAKRQAPSNRPACTVRTRQQWQSVLCCKFGMCFADQIRVFESTIRKPESVYQWQRELGTMSPSGLPLKALRCTEGSPQPLCNTNSQRGDCFRALGDPPNTNHHIRKES